ncbi:MAG: hypothetical protein M1608_04755 [Candidatus Omnitrophica bacterium]|nr:hypothetical protein [Candidatus Omnitrophota bacterium]
MGYAKYTEKIEKIHSQNIFGTWLDFQVFDEGSHCERSTSATGRTDHIPPVG